MNSLRLPPIVRAHWAELSEQIQQLAPAVEAWLYTNMPLIVAVELECQAIEIRARADQVVNQARRGTVTAQDTANEIHKVLISEAARLEARARELRSQSAEAVTR